MTFVKNDTTTQGNWRQTYGTQGYRLVGNATNLPSSMPYHASTLYSRNVSALLTHVAPGGELALDWSDEITAGACVAGKQEVTA